jgi:hypothetical protein
MNWLSILIHAVFGLAIIVALVIVPFVLATMARFIYGPHEGYFSILTWGVKDGTYMKTVGSMKGYEINPVTSAIDPNPNAKPTRGFLWLGIWPLASAMKFEDEQVKIVNKPDGTIDWELVKFPASIYVPILRTERLQIKQLELADLATRVDLDAIVTLRVRNGYRSKVENRGNAKKAKGIVQEGLKEFVVELGSYDEVLKMKNATAVAKLKALVAHINSPHSGFKSLAEDTGYELDSIIIPSIELSGKFADKMAEAFAKPTIAAQEALATVAKAGAERTRLREEGIGKAEGAEMLLRQTIRRITAERKMTDGQALAMSIENGLANTQAAVVNLNVGGSQQSGGTPVMVNLPPKAPKSPTPPTPPAPTPATTGTTPVI